MTVAGIAQVPHMHRVVTAIAVAIAIETGISVEHSRTKSGTHHDVVMVGPVSC